MNDSLSEITLEEMPCYFYIFVFTFLLNAGGIPVFNYFECVRII